MMSKNIKIPVILGDKILPLTKCDGIYFSHEKKGEVYEWEGEGMGKLMANWRNGRKLKVREWES